MQRENISDIIETYLKTILAQEAAVEIRRAEIARRFNCVPSQINYVIKTRFTPARGYIVESKRGGGGYIRITKIESNDKSAFLNHLKKLTGKQVSQQNAERIIAGLYDNELITLREKKLIMSAIHRDTLMMEVPYRDYIRANILQNVLAIIQYN